MTISTSVDLEGGWELGTELPGDWAELVRSLGGGFFHTPLGLRAGAPAGEPVFARYVHLGEAVAISAGVRTPCRLSGRSRHLYFPTPPMFRPGIEREEALVRLADRLREEGIAEVRWDSFDVGSVGPPAPVPTRWEYVIDLPAMAEQSVWPESSHHRRYIRRGDRAGWGLRELTGAAAVAALTQVSDQATLRAALRGSHMDGAVPPVVTDATEPSPHWGATTYAAYDDEELLAAVLVGRGATRAYYIMGGATQFGYSIGASTWLHAQLTSRFADAGMLQYNLGGVPLHAHDPSDPSFGLHRFKSAFGATIVGCAGDQWVLHSAHQHGHKLLGWATAVLA